MKQINRRRCLKQMGLAGLAVLGGAGCKQRVETASDPAFQNDLIRALTVAQRVRIIEHSSPLDRKEWDENAPERIYREKDLPPESKNRLIEKLANMSPVLPAAYAACAPHFHHRIELSDPASPPVEICFLCGQVHWAGSSGSYPAAIFEVLSGFLEAEGMERSRDWTRLADEAMPSGQ